MCVIAMQSVLKILDILCLGRSRLTEKGSACSQEMWALQEDESLSFSGRDSGTATRMKKTSSTAMAVARPTTRSSLCTCNTPKGTYKLYTEHKTTFRVIVHFKRQF